METRQSTGAVCARATEEAAFARRFSLAGDVKIAHPDRESSTTATWQRKAYKQHDMWINLHTTVSPHSVYIGLTIHTEARAIMPSVYRDRVIRLLLRTLIRMERCCTALRFKRAVTESVR